MSKRSRVSGIWVVVIALLALMTTSCEGPMGAQGPAGTANVVYSDWTAFDSSNWSELKTRFGIAYREYRIDEPRIDDDIVATGSVAVYVQLVNTAPEVDPLPFMGYLTKAEMQILDFTLEPGAIVLRLRDQDGVDNPGTFGGSSNVFRYVIVPGGTQLSAGSGLPNELEG